MTGGILQLIAKNYDDLYLTISPQVTMFKLVYRRYTNFSLCDDDIFIKSGGNFSSKTTIKLENKADLLHKMYIVAELPQIKISKKKPSFNSLQKLLSTYGIIWDYSGFGVQGDDMVTLNNYDISGGIYSITNVINNRIEFLIKNYNFFNNGLIMSNDIVSNSNVGLLNTLILSPFDRLQNSSGLFLSMDSPDKFKQISTDLLTGRSVAMELLYRTLFTYSQDYGASQMYAMGSTKLSSDMTSQQTLIYPKPKTLSLYTQNTTKALLENGILLGALKAYSKDASIYNSNYSYNNSGFITTGYLPNITSSGIGIFYRNVLYETTITDAVISGNIISGGTITGTFVDPAMSANMTNITGINIINAIISSTDGTIYTNYSILNCSITTSSLNSVTIFGTITNGTMTPSTIKGITINNATFTNSVVTGGTLTIPTITTTILNTGTSVGTILLPMVQIIGPDNVKRIKTLYNCTISGDNIGTSSGPVTRTISSGTEAYIVITDAELINNSTITPSSTSISSGTLKNGKLVSNNVSIPQFVSNVVLLNVAVKQIINVQQKIRISITPPRYKTRTITTVVTQIYNMSNVTLSGVTFSSGKISTAQIVSGIIHPINNYIPNAIITSATYNTQYLTGGTLSGGTMYNYAIEDINIATGGLPSAFLTNVTLVDTNGVQYLITELDNLNLSYTSTITDVIITGNTHNPVYIPDIAINSYDNAKSAPLFGNLLNRNGIVTNTSGTSTIYFNDSPEILKFPLYNSNDFLYITYLTYLNNIIRIKIIDGVTTDSFNPTYSSVLKGNLKISTQNLSILTPQLLSLDESILFYHIIDPDITKYTINGTQSGTLTLNYFNDIITSSYNIINNYNKIIPVARDLYTNTDAYMIYSQYMSNLSNTNQYISTNSVMTSIAQDLMDYINENINYNFLQLYQILAILYNGYRTISSSYIITFYKKYTYSNSSYSVAEGSTSFTSITGNTSGLINLNDNFLSVLNQVKPTQSQRNDITHFFNDYINNQFETFISNCSNYLISSDIYKSYYDDYSLWARNLYKNGESLYMVYTAVINAQHLSTNANINSTTFQKISLSSYIPFLAAIDIPQMIYNIFNTYADNIFQPFLDFSGSFTITSPDYLSFKNTFIKELYKYTDAPNGGISQSNSGRIYNLKLNIYTRIINSIFITGSGSSTTFLNKNYFEALQTSQASSTNYLLAFTFRPEQFMCPASTEYPPNSGSLLDLNLNGNTLSISDSSQIVYLPIEWLTQTYYNIYGSVTDSLIDTSSSYIWESNSLTINMYTLKQTLRGIIANILNCFIANSSLPLLSKYKSNNYTLLGLLPETNSVLNDNTKSALIGTNVQFPLYCDAISSIVYQTQKKFIQYYNQLFNNSILSKSYYSNNLGNSMTSLYDYIATQFNLADSTNIKYDSSTSYPNLTPGTISFANNFSRYIDSSGYMTNLTTYPTAGWTNEMYPAIDSANKDIGFDVYRLSNLNSTVVISNINTFINDYITLYQYMLIQYNQYKGILAIKNDTTNLKINGVLPDGTPDYTNTIIIQQSEFMYGQSQIINNYIYSNVYIKYINPLIMSSKKTLLTNLALNTMNYWIPQFNSSGEITNNGLLGPLDLLYGTLDTGGNLLPYDSNGNVDYSKGTINYPSGNLSFELNKLTYIPPGKTANDFIDLSNSTNNPFTSFFLHDWYLSLQSSEKMILDSSGNYKITMDSTVKCIKYQTLINAVEIFNLLIGTTDNQTITSEYIMSNPYTLTLYTSTRQNLSNNMSGSVFGDASIVANMMFDNICMNVIENMTNGTFQTGSVVSGISYSQVNNGYTETLKNFNTVFTNAVKNLSTELKKLTKFRDSTIFDLKYNNNNQYIDITNSNDPHSPYDVYYYYSSQSNYLINTELETTIITAINLKPAKFAWVKELGLKLIKNVSIKIGGQIIDSHSSELMHFINKIYRNGSQKRGYDIMIGNTPELYKYSESQRLQNKLYIPLNFWFNKHVGNALPLLCLLYSDIELIIEINNYFDVLIIEKDSYFIKIPKLKTKIYTQYIYLDEEERHRMAQTKLEYLVESFNYSGLKIYSSKNLISNKDAQIVSTNKNYITNDIKKEKQLTPTIKYDIYLSDPTKYLIWYVKIFDKTTQNPLDLLDWTKFGCNFIDGSGNLINTPTIFSSISLQMNGTNREEPKIEDFYTYVSPYSKGVPGIKTGEYFYSYALYPMLLQPSGSANYTELNDSSVTMVLTDYMLQKLKENPNVEIQIELWGCANKILRVISGFGALAFYK